MIFPFHLVNDPGRQNNGYYSFDAATAPLGPIEPAFSAVTSALRQIAGRTVEAPQADVAVLHSLFHKTYRTRMTAAADMKNALADLGVRATVVYDHEVREHPQLLRSFKAVIVPRLMIAREDCDDLSVLHALDDYARSGGRLIVAGAYDRVTAQLSPVDSSCRRGTNDMLASFPARIERLVAPGDAQYEPFIRFVQGGFPWVGRPVRVDAIAHPDVQVRLQPDANAVVLARYADSDGPAVVASAARPRHAFGDVVMIGPRLRFASGDLNDDRIVDNADLALLRVGQRWGQDGYDRYADYLTGENFGPGSSISADDVTLWWRFSATNDNFSLVQFLRQILADWDLLPVKIEQGRGILAHLGVDGISIVAAGDTGTDFVIRLPFKAMPRDHEDAQYFPAHPSDVIRGRLAARQAIFIRLKGPRPD